MFLSDNLINFILFVFFLSQPFLLQQIFCEPLSPSVFLPEFQEAEQQFIDNRNSMNQGQFVTAPSSPKQRHSTFFQPQQQQQLQQQQQQQQYSFTFPTPEQQFQAQLMQRLQNLSGYQTHPYSMYSPNVYQTLPSGLYSFSNTLPHIKSYKSPPATKSGSSNDVNLDDPAGDLPPRLDPPPASRRSLPQDGNRGLSSSTGKRKAQAESQPAIKIPSQNLQTPKTPIQSPKSSYQNALASALSSIMTLRVSDGKKQAQQSQQSQQNQANGPPFITRSTSEKVPNRSELMDQVQRTAWARRTK